MTRALRGLGAVRAESRPANPESLCAQAVDGLDGAMRTPEGTSDRSPRHRPKPRPIQPNPGSDRGTPASRTPCRRTLVPNRQLGGCPPVLRLGSWPLRAAHDCTRPIEAWSTPLVHHFADAGATCPGAVHTGCPRGDNRPSPEPVARRARHTPRDDRPSTARCVRPVRPRYHRSMLFDYAAVSPVTVRGDTDAGLAAANDLVERVAYGSGATFDETMIPLDRALDRAQVA